GKGVLALLEKTGRLERDIKALEEAAAEFKAQALLENAELRSGGINNAPALAQGDLLLAQIFPGTGIDEILRIGRAAQKKTGDLLVLASEKDLKFAAFCSQKGRDIRPLIKDAMEKQGGRGGGGPGFFQGLFESPEALSAFMAAVRDTAGTGENQP
ncbi:MAG: alanyl-tRNA editing protein, partial [Treponema sp.]|nr:alanyl-tRNA editing protein [Treponema sp.]